MPSIADMLVGAGLQTSAQSADLAGASAQGAKIGIELGQTILNAQNQRAQIEQKKEELEYTKQEKLLNRVEIGLTKVPKKAQPAYFKSLQNDAGALKMGISDDFVSAVTSPDINQGAMAQDLANYRLAYRHGLETKDFTELRELSPKILDAFGGNVEMFGDYINKVMSSETAAIAQERAARASAGQKNVDNTEGLRKEYTSHPTTKKTLDMTDSFSKIKKSLGGKPSAAGDMSGIFAYMKMLDPASTVREGEYANAQNAGGLPDKVVVAYNQAYNGQLLSPEMRKDFMAQAQKLQHSQRERQKKIDATFSNIATKTGIDKSLAVVGTEPSADEEKTYDVRGRIMTETEIKAMPPAIQKFLDPAIKKELGIK
jgi:hypothetical protein